MQSRILPIYAFKFNLNIEKNCSQGCLCGNYQCDLPEKKAILTLSTWNKVNSPVLIKPEGKYKNPLKSRLFKPTYFKNFN